MTLADSLYKRSEGDGFLDICVLPRIDIQQEIEFQLTVNELTALGKISSITSCKCRFFTPQKAAISTHQQYSVEHSLWEVNLRFVSHLLSLMMTVWKMKSHFKLLSHIRLMLILISTAIQPSSSYGTMTVS